MHLIYSKYICKEKIIYFMSFYHDFGDLTELRNVRRLENDGRAILTLTKFQLILANGLLKESLTGIRMLSKNKKAMVRTSVTNTDFYEILVGILQEDTSASYQFIICLYHIYPTTSARA